MNIQNKKINHMTLEFIEIRLTTLKKGHKLSYKINTYFKDNDCYHKIGKEGLFDRSWSKIKDEFKFKFIDLNILFSENDLKELNDIIKNDYLLCDMVE